MTPQTKQDFENAPPPPSSHKQHTKRTSQKGTQRQTTDNVRSALPPETRAHAFKPALLSGFCSVKRLGVFTLPLDGILVHHRLPPQAICWFPFIHLGGERHCETELSGCTGQDSNARPSGPKSDALTTDPPRLKHSLVLDVFPFKMKYPIPHGEWRITRREKSP